ncbi:hypothetical protein RCOM_1170820 [Ricinus communis]|uniref:Uncharacterized protein n=1 Tax=Ricinus communis TaxID=3988 RepID=B9T451_RICCO|nr:hypothetical protein RCOM_1170820 [Ricinus communis]
MYILLLMQRDTTGLTAENKELKLRLQAMEQQAHLRDALNEALREEVQRLKIATGQIPAVNGNLFGRDSEWTAPSGLCKLQSEGLASLRKVKLVKGCECCSELPLVT